MNIIISKILAGLSAVCFILLFSFHTSAQNLDSLWQVYNTSVEDTVHFNSLKALSNYYVSNRINHDTAVDLTSELVELSLKNKDGESYGQGIYWQGFLNYSDQEYGSAIKHFQRSIEIYDSIGGHQDGIAASYNSIGGMYYNLGNYPVAIENFHTSLTYTDSTNYPQRARLQNNLGLINNKMGNDEEALMQYRASLNFRSLYNDSIGLATLYNNFGTLYSSMNDFDSAMYYYDLSLIVKRRVSSPSSITQALVNIGTVYTDLDSFDLAEQYFEEAIQVQKEAGNESHLGSCYQYMGRSYLKQGRLKESINTCKKGLALADSAEMLLTRSRCYECLYLSYEQLGNDHEAFRNYKLYIADRDSLINEEKLSEIETAKLTFKFNQEQLADSLDLAKRDAIQLEESRVKEKEEKYIRFGLILGLGVLVIIALIIYIGYRNKSKANRTITYQKDLVEVKNREILDSINYARRLQNAILPPQKLVKEYLPSSFILYKPKDIVAGDFYWMEQKEGRVLFASADCTGHGVPGAMVSVICNGALNRSVREFGLTNPADILGKSREIVIQEFEKSDEKVSDGMDIALCSIKGMHLEYAGAHNPLWIVRNGELTETKADKQPIGKYDDLKPYTSHSIELQKGDAIYIFSDGYIDQFGGEKGKKFKAKAFRELLLSIQEHSMEKQRELIDSAFESWRGNLEQIDDVCVIGVRV